MAWIFAESYDPYAAGADAFAGYWDSGSLGSGTLVAGRFAGSQAVNIPNTTVSFVKSSGQNDAIHHISVAFRQTAVLSGTTLATYFQFTDNATNQCCIVFRSDGAILLTSATPAGTVLATYAGGVSAQNTWFQFEFEVIISNTAGRFRVRKNGNTVDDFDSGAVLNTRPGANSYANKLTLAQNTGLNAQQLDDLLWRSDAASVPWVGDIRAYTRMPAADASVQFARAPASATFYQNTGSTGGGGPTANLIWWYSIQAPYSGSITALNANFQAAVTGHVNMALYDATGAAIATSNGGAVPNGGPGPGALQSIATPLTNPALGLQAFTLVTPITVTKGQYLWVGMIGDASLATAISGPVTQASATLAFAYASGAFPATGAGFAISANHTGFAYLGATMTPSNAGLVNETLQDGTTSYVYDAVAGHSDFYTVAALGSTPASTVAVTTRAFVAKSDAGTRTGAVQLRSGSSFVGTNWNPADSTNIALSGGNLTATATPGPAGVRSLLSTTSGKVYWEVTAGAVFSNSSSGIGAANTSASLTGMGGLPANAGLVYPNGAVYVNNINVGTIGGGTISPGVVVCIALDLSTFNIWFRRGAAGQWNNSGTANPATNVGGISVSGIFSASIAAFAAVSMFASGESVIANFGGSAFSGPAPSGFTAGLGAIGSTVASPTLALSTSFLWTWRTDTVDPATGSAWTAAAVSAATIGTTVIA